MLETSKDLLYVSISFAVIWITIFISWALYYMIMMLRNASKMTASIREKLELVDRILKLIKDKLEKGSNHMAILSDSAIKLVGFLMEKQKSSKSGTGSKKSKKK